MPEYIKTVATAERGLGKANIRAKWSHVADTVFFFQAPFHSLKCKHFFFSLAWEGVIECKISTCLKMEKSTSSSVLLFFGGGIKGKCCKQPETHQNDHPPWDGLSECKVSACHKTGKLIYYGMLILNQWSMQSLGGLQQVCKKTNKPKQ